MQLPAKRILRRKLSSHDTLLMLASAETCTSKSLANSRRDRFTIKNEHWRNWIGGGCSVSTTATSHSCSRLNLRFLALLIKLVMLERCSDETSSFISIVGIKSRSGNSKDFCGHIRIEESFLTVGIKLDTLEKVSISKHPTCLQYMMSSSL